MQINRLRLAAAATILLAGCASGPDRLTQSKYEPTLPFSAEREISLDGIWYHDVFGLLVEIKGSEISLWHRANGSCWPERVEEVREQYMAWLTEYSIVSDKSAIYFRPSSGATALEFKALPELPPVCRDDADPETVVEAFKALFDKHYPFFGVRGIEWARRKAEVPTRLGPATDDQSLRRHMLALLAGLADPLVAIRTDAGWWHDPESDGLPMQRLRQAFTRQNVIESFPEYERLWYAAVRERIRSSVLIGEHHTAANGAMVWGTMESGAGYLQIQSLGANEDTLRWERSLSDARTYLEKRPVLLLDLSIASGGEDRAARAVASEFLGKDAVLYLTRAYQARDSEWKEHESSARGRAFSKPIFLLTSEQTSGAAERVVLALQAQPGLLQVGATTRGAMSGPLIKSLPNGWLLQLGVIVYADRNQVSYDGVGLAPDFAMSLYPEGQLSQGHHRAVITLADLIAEGHFDARK